MRPSFSFTCPTCGESHKGSPSVAFASPYHWHAQQPDTSTGKSRLSDDFCMIEERDYFIRCILEVPIVGVEDPFLWGVWVSQSATNFRDYVESFPDTPERQTFGYLSNRLPGYPDTINLHTQTRWQRGTKRPLVELKAVEHPLYHDWSSGITWERAIELAAPAFHPRDN
ncbi:DUF2199 domain-containing protein [Dongia deserti]|uniref:DUF2199 domain-containing protein n=1 Tax=Dongia deserti TaxID=2268030 RepID=UPI0013C4166B|nr:DUF2199 domain-containing protein [Dongia deserti]